MLTTEDSEALNSISDDGNLQIKIEQNKLRCRERKNEKEYEGWHDLCKFDLNDQTQNLIKSILKRGASFRISNLRECTSKDCKHLLYCIDVKGVFLVVVVGQNAPPSHALDITGLVEKMGLEWVNIPEKTKRLNEFASAIKKYHEDKADPAFPQPLLEFADKVIDANRIEKVDYFPKEGEVPRTLYFDVDDAFWVANQDGIQDFSLVEHPELRVFSKDESLRPLLEKTLNYALKNHCDNYILVKKTEVESKDAFKVDFCYCEREVDGKKIGTIIQTDGENPVSKLFMNETINVEPSKTKAVAAWFSQDKKSIIYASKRNTSNLAQKISGKYTGMHLPAYFLRTDDNAPEVVCVGKVGEKVHVLSSIFPPFTKEDDGAIELLRCLLLAINNSNITYKVWWKPGADPVEVGFRAPLPIKETDQTGVDVLSRIPVGFAFVFKKGQTCLDAGYFEKTNGVPFCNDYTKELFLESLGLGDINRQEIVEAKKELDLARFHFLAFCKLQPPFGIANIFAGDSDNSEPNSVESSAQMEFNFDDYCVPLAERGDKAYALLLGNLKIMGLKVERRYLVCVDSTGVHAIPLTITVPENYPEASTDFLWTKYKDFVNDVYNDVSAKDNPPIYAFYGRTKEPEGEFYKLALLKTNGDAKANVDAASPPLLRLVQSGDGRRYGKNQLDDLGGLKDDYANWNGKRVNTRKELKTASDFAWFANLLVSKGEEWEKAFSRNPIGLLPQPKQKEPTKQGSPQTAP